MSRTMLRIEEVAVLCGVSTQTINIWYRFKKENPDNEYAKLLPEFQRIGTHGQRFWDKSDINAILNFKTKMPTGRNGVMGSVTQRYLKKG